MQLGFHEYDEWKCMMILYIHVKYKMLHAIENCVWLALSNYGRKGFVKVPNQERRMVQ